MERLTNRYSDSQQKLKFLTLDASQGSEADCVRISLCNNLGTPGFLRSKKRVNVMISRARQMVFYVRKWSYIRSPISQDCSPTPFNMLDYYSKHIPNFVITL